MRTPKSAIGALMAAGMLFSACGSDSKETAGTEPAAAASTEAAAATTAAAGSGGASSLLNGEIQCEQQYAGKTVTLYSPVRNSDNDPDAIADFVAGYNPLQRVHRSDVDFQGSDQFETEINVRLEGGDPPDVIDYPQPGLLRSHVAKGYLASAATLTWRPTSPATSLRAGTSTPRAPTAQIYGLPGRSSVKSMVWYSPKAFADGGYAIPTTLEELTTLSEKIVADGKTPWCIGAESGVATGWVITDWIEDFMLRTNGGEVYDQWVNHTIPFNDPKVMKAVDAVGSFVKNADYLGGENLVKSIATTKFQDGGLPILAGKCFMHRQASFYRRQLAGGHQRRP